MKINRRGFTLVEIMVVIAIIAVIAAVAIPNLLRARISSHEASAQATLKSISTAMESYAAINDVYPPTTTALVGPTPPYLTTDFFTGTHNGYTFSVNTLADYDYSIEATPASSNSGRTTYTISTGSIMTSSP